MQFHPKYILKALLLAPIALLVILACLFIVMNHEYNLQAILTVLGVTLLIYFSYCVVTVPISYAISVLLSRKNRLTFFSIIFGSWLMWAIVSMIGYLLFTGTLPTPFWKLFTDWFFYCLAMFVGCCYWGILYLLENRQRNETTRY
ncbi:hypothetical protein BEN71_02615 [Acinetobacter wuhouensis]|uniref:hypothetical protein n=1 Tax=Acinetobacter wuhouensis TaxID=1879050 RepID=UPI00083A0FDB|nr:hypothetical protein [Acinetobacter wuhouensis]AXQ21054.1 hypothetical protein BEN71_02615 [Acinetobacter wuhouensis]